MFPWWGDEERMYAGVGIPCKDNDDARLSIRQIIICSCRGLGAPRGHERHRNPRNIQRKIISFNFSCFSIFLLLLCAFALEANFIHQQTQAGTYCTNLCLGMILNCQDRG